MGQAPFLAGGKERRGGEESQVGELRLRGPSSVPPPSLLGCLLMQAAVVVVPSRANDPHVLTLGLVLKYLPELVSPGGVAEG